jgi:hypothetical protein
MYRHHFKFVRNGNRKKLNFEKHLKIEIFSFRQEACANFDFIISNFCDWNAMGPAAGCQP